MVTSPLRWGVGVLGATTHLLNVSGHRRRLVRRTVERLVRIFFHAGLCRFEIVRGVCAGCWRGDGSRMECSAIAAPRCRADRIISQLPAHMWEPIGVGVWLFCCALTGLLFTSERQRPPAAPCAPYGGAPCSTHCFSSIIQGPFLSSTLPI